MDWARQHYERVTLIAASLLLAICAFFIWRSASDFGGELTSIGSGARKPATPPGKALEVEQASQLLRQPSQWTFTGRSGLFVPERHFIAANGFPATLQTTEL